jgi:dTDP-4-amino-4,6-dideoxygalactose transaminase
MNLKASGEKSLKLSFGTIDIEEFSKNLIFNALSEKRLSCGRMVYEFEQQFASITGAREAVAVSTGTDADTLALAVLHDFGAKRGDEVIVPALSFIATGNAVLHAGFNPVFVDIDIKTLNIDPSKIDAAITDRTIAIMPVHLMGKPAPMDSIMEIAEKHKLYVIEDAAEAHGMVYKGRNAGTIGDMGAFSTYIAHIITTIEGGVVTTEREDFAEILRSLRSHGRNCTCRSCVLNIGATYCRKRFERKNVDDIRFTFDRVGYSCKMNELEAAVGLGSLKRYNEILEKRYANLKYALKEMAQFEPYLYTIKEESHEKIGPHALPIIIGREASFSRKDLINHLAEGNIDSRTLFNSIPTQCKGYGFLGYKYSDFPNAEYIGTNGIHIGVHQNLNIEHMEYLVAKLREFIEIHQR